MTRATAPGADPGRPTWREAWALAAYGPGGFWRRESPARHFRTSAHASPVFARAIGRLAREHGLDAVVDLGAGSGELLAALHEADPGLRLLGVDLRPRPDGLPGGVAWAAQLPERVEGLVVANEWLDDLPCDVVEVGPGGVPRLVHVEPATGEEALGAIPAGEDARWLARWWPLEGRPAGARAEIGWPRDAAWADVVRRTRRGLLLAVDYGHRADRRPASGTLTGFRGGRQVPPVPDGSGNLTAHVAMDAVAAAGEAAGARTLALTTQAAALRGLGVTATRPSRESAVSDPPGYLRALAAAGEAAELLEPAGLGGFCWLLQAVGPDAGGEAAGTPAAF